MKLHRRILSTIAMAVVTAVALSGCALNSSADDKVVIGLAVANQQADFFNLIRQAAEERANELGVELVISDAMGDADTQVSQVQNFITRDVDAIIYIPAGAAAATVPVRDAKAAGIPVVTVDRNPETEPGDTFIATDSVAAAEVLGAWVGEQTKGEGKIGVIQGQVGTTPEIQRDTGFKEGIAKFPGLKEVARQSSDQWAQDEGLT